MATFKEIGDDFEKTIRSLSNFKIGKTGQTKRERYDEGYSNDYNEILELGSSKEKSTIDNFEKYMIDRFQHLKNCDNDQVGGGEMKDSEKYIVYLVYNE